MSATPMADLNTLDDWWNEGFDDYFDGADWREHANIKIGDGSAARAWFSGWVVAEIYRHSMIRDLR